MSVHIVKKRLIRADSDGKLTEENVSGTLAYAVGDEMSIEQARKLGLVDGKPVENPVISPAPEAIAERHDRVVTTGSIKKRNHP